MKKKKLGATAKTYFRLGISIKKYNNKKLWNFSGKLAFKKFFFLNIVYIFWGED